MYARPYMCGTTKKLVVNKQIVMTTIPAATATEAAAKQGKNVEQSLCKSREIPEEETRKRKPQ